MPTDQKHYRIISMRIIETLSVKQLYPLDVYVGYFGDCSFKTPLGKRTFENYLYKIHIATVYNRDNLFKIRLDAVRAFIINRDYYAHKVSDGQISLKYTTVWGFQMVESRVYLDNRESIIQQKKYVRLAGLDGEAYNDALMEQ